MEPKKYLSLERLTEYDTLLKDEIDSKDASILTLANEYSDNALIEQIATTNEMVTFLNITLKETNT